MMVAMSVACGDGGGSVGVTSLSGRAVTCCFLGSLSTERARVLNCLLERLSHSP